MEEVYGPQALSSSAITVSRRYNDPALYYSVTARPVEALAHLVRNAGLDASRYAGKDAEEVIAALKADTRTEAAVALAEAMEGTDVSADIRRIISARVPRFQYFDEFNVLPGRVSIRKLQSGEANLDPSERTALALLRLAGVETQEFTESDYEPRKAALEAAANHLTDELFTYWRQNKELSVELDIEFEHNAAAPYEPPEPFLQIRVRNSRHRITLNMAERSRGFIWFFSFLAAFSEYAGEERRIILLDEPGLSLHAMAQNDLLRFIDERLAPHHQILYSTHSLFMIEPTKLERCRTVEDIDDDGTKVSQEIWEARPDTVFPLLGALGVDMTQTLIIGTDQLLVKGPSEVVYLNLLSDLAREAGKAFLDPRWTITPVGSLDKVPTFIALLRGGKLNISVIFDVAAGGNQRMSNFMSKGIIDANHLIPLTEITGTAEADIEDLFEVPWYLSLLDQSKVKKIAQTELSGTGRIIKQIETFLGGPFDHFQPASYLLRRFSSLLDEISEPTVELFSALFERVNATLSK